MIALALPATNEGGFVPPAIEEMHLPEIFPWGAEYGTGFGKQMLLVIISVIIIAVFFILASRKGKLVPGRLQWLMSDTDKATERADGRLQTVLGQMDDLGTPARVAQSGQVLAGNYLAYAGAQCLR